MIALAAALECERGLRKCVNAHIANTATPKAYDIAAGLELELRKLEEVLVLLSAKAGRVWEGQSFVGGPGPVVVVGQSPLHSSAAVSSATSRVRSPKASDGTTGNRRMTAAKEAEAAQHEMLGSLASQLARLSAGLSNFSSANDLLKELAEQQTLTNAMRVMCSSSAKSLASLASPPAGTSGSASGSGGGVTRAAKNASRASRNAAAGARGGSGAVGKYGKLAPVLTPGGGWNNGGSGVASGIDDEDASSMDGWSNSPPPSPLASSSSSSSSRRAASSSSSSRRSGGGTPFATPSGVSPGLSFRGNDTRGDESSVDLSVRKALVIIVVVVLFFFFFFLLACL